MQAYVLISIFNCNHWRNTFESTVSWGRIRGGSTHIITVDFKLKARTISEQKDKDTKDKNKQFTNEKKKPEYVIAYERMGSLPNIQRNSNQNNGTLFLDNEVNRIIKVLTTDAGGETSSTLENAVCIYQNPFKVSLFYSAALVLINLVTGNAVYTEMHINTVTSRTVQVSIMQVSLS